MLSQRGSHTKRHFYILAVLIPLLLVSALFVLIGIAPFGSHNLLVSDLSTQYLQFFAELKRQMAHFSFSSYSFLMSIGDSLVPIYAYYLLSPLNIIILFFGNAQLPIAIDLIIWLKLILCSVSMSVFLGKKYQMYDLMAIYGGFAYGLCGFVSMYFYDLMWLDALIWLPVMIYGLEKLYYYGKPTIYVISLVAIILTNFYMGYIICVFNVLYMAFLLKKNQPYRLPFFENLKANWRKIGWFIWYSLLSGLTTAVVLIPTAIAMMATGKKDLSVVNFLFKGTFGLSFPVNFGVGGNDFAGRLVHNPSFFTGSLFIVGIVVYFLSKMITKRDKQAAGILVGGIFVGMWLLPLNTIWHMMQQPAGFPFRMVFLFSFAIIMITYEGYLQGMFAEEKLLIRCAAGITVAILIGYVFANIDGQKMMEFRFDIPQLSVSNIVLVFVVGFMIVTTIALIGVGKQRRSSQIFLGFILAAELGLNFMIATDGAPFGNQKAFEHTYAQSIKKVDTIEKQNQSDRGFYRFVIVNKPFRNLFKVPYNGYNDSFLYRNYGISSYSSTLNTHTHHVLGDLGFSSRNIRRIDSFGGTAITNYFFGLKDYYFIGNDTNKLTVRKQTAGLGFTADNQIQHLKLRRELVFDNLNRFVQKVAGNHKQYIVKPTIVSNAHYVTRDYFGYKAQFYANTTGPQYLYVPRVRLIGVSIYVNGQKLSNLYSGLGTEMVPLGYMQKGQISTVTIHSNKELPKIPRDIGGINMRNLKQVVKDQNKHLFKLQNPSRLNEHGGHFKGTVNVGNKARTLVITIPFDQGWQVKVDGQQQAVKRVAGGLVGIPLSKGSHHIAFNYHIRGLLAGVGVTLLGLVSLCCTAIWRYYRRKV
ncbi:YfhO family protein [Lentilactobacillus kefiri]|nr:YfhO family protein [Lentilactobacillus kefiri]MCJ2160971.1 YfhO family protein [Lentilactobacillus kefiri]MCP9368899.1 YfhO family protein [Lentilactobacillus kefiri]MDH5108364.1 YfhO family protein [Lentilactobacillus kefiri]MDM7493953.1 YfhO family protein [Lentilactobacillus kefiri]PAK59043.1 hypothetical protein B9K02_08405 [Lentilactobacillus kefiri]